MSRKKPIIQRLIIAILLTTCTLIIYCTPEHPPFTEYQVIGFTPIDSVEYGDLFVSGNHLYALYDVSQYNQWSRVCEYDLADPTQPELLSAEEFDPMIISYVIGYQDSLVFLYNYYYLDLYVFNLNMREPYLLDVEYNVYDVAHKTDYLLISTYDGFHVLDISNLPNYTTVFIDSGYRSSGNLSLRDTILLEVYRDSEYKFKFYNIANPEQPQIISQGSMPDQRHPIYDIHLSDQYIICFNHDALHRYYYGPYDSLTYEDALYFSHYYDEQRASDSLIYLVFRDHIEIVRIDDFTSQCVFFSKFSGDYAISMEVFEERVYGLIRNRGIQIYERRAQ